MYVSLLEGALDDWVDTNEPAATFEHARVCRSRMALALTHGSSYSALAAQLSYDRSLIKLCETLHVESSARRFAHPLAERHRLERELARLGLDLGPDELSRADRSIA